MRRTIKDIVTAVLLMLAGAGAAIVFRGCLPTKKEEPRTLVVLDTVVVRDTITVIAPRPQSDSVVGQVTVKLPSGHRLDEDSILANLGKIGKDWKDSAEVVVPISQQHYADTLYDIWVSGYLPRVDSVRVYPRTTYITKMVKETRYEKRRPWSVGVGVGYGLTGKQFTPYIGIGVYFKMIDF